MGGMVFLGCAMAVVGGVSRSVIKLVWSYQISDYCEQKSDSKKLWCTVSTVLCKSAGKSTSLPFSPVEIPSFLESKVETIWYATASAPPSVFTHTDSNLDLFDICRPDEISKIIKAPAAKSCDLDPAPTFLVKECLDVLLPHLTRLCNVSIQNGCLPLSQKTAVVMLCPKKSGLDSAEIKNYRPISNLPFMSKVIEKLILAQLTRFLTVNGLFPKFQSGFCRYHSTKTTALKSSLQHLLSHRSRSGLLSCPTWC